MIAQICIQQKSAWVLALELHKVKNNYLPEIFSDLFCQKQTNCYNPRQQRDFIIHLWRSVYHGIQSISWLGTKYVLLLLPQWKFWFGKQLTIIEKWCRMREMRTALVCCARHTCQVLVTLVHAFKATYLFHLCYIIEDFNLLFCFMMYNGWLWLNRLLYGIVTFMVKSGIREGRRMRIARIYVCILFSFL